MDPLFQVSTTINKESYRARVTADYAFHHKPHTAVFYGVLVALAIFLWWGAVFASGQAVPPLYAALYGAVLLAIAILAAPYLEHFATKRNAARMLKSTLKKASDLNAVANIAFTDGGFFLENSASAVERAYSVLSTLGETRSYFVLIEGKEFFFTLSKKGFTKGTADEFRTFLAQKCGKEFKFLDF